MKKFLGKVKAFRVVLWFLLFSVITSIILMTSYGFYEGVQAGLQGVDITNPEFTKKLEADMNAFISNPTYITLMLAVFCLIYYLIRHKKLNVQIQDNKPSKAIYGRYFGFALSLGYVLTFAMNLVAGLLIEFNVVTEETINSLAMSVPHEMPGYLFAVLAIAIVTPIYEELVFRKLFINDLLCAFGRKTSLIIACVVFVLLHGISLNLIYSIAVGTVAIYSYQKYGKILIPILVHIGFNTVGTFDWLFTEEMVVVAIILLCVAVLALIYFVVDFILKRKRQKMATEAMA